MTISTLDILYLSLSAGFLVLVAYVVVLIKRVHKSLDKLDPILDNVQDTTGGIRDLKDQAKSTMFSAVSMIAGLFAGRKK